MIASVLYLTRWEFFKVRRRQMPWILLGIIVVVAQVALWSAYISYQTTDLAVIEISGSNERGSYSYQLSCRHVEAGQVPPLFEGIDEDAFLEEIERHRHFCENLDEEEKAFRELSRQSFILPGSLSNSYAIVPTIAVVLILVLSSSAIGVEYGWGTLRTALTRGAGRWQILASKVFALVLMGATALFILSLTVVVSSLIAASLTLHEGGGLADSGQWSTAVVMFGKAVYGITPYILLALFFTVLASSPGVGMAVTLGYYLTETITVAILINLFDWLDNVTDFLLGTNIAAWMAEANVDIPGVNSALFETSHLPGTLHSFLVLLGYTIVLGCAACWLFMRRDIVGARGE